MQKPIRQIRIEGNIAFVPLTKGYEAVIDADDVHLVDGVSWRSIVARRTDGSIRTVYAIRSLARVRGMKRPFVQMHRLLAAENGCLEVDHRDGDGLNNRRENLRCADKSKNQCNARLSLKNTSGFRGVSWHKATGKWQASIKLNGKRTHLGLYHEKTEAAKAYASASASLHGEFGIIS